MLLRRTSIVFLLAASGWVGQAAAQSTYSNQQQFDSEYLEPYTDPTAGASITRLSFLLEAEIPLPGP